MRTRNEIYLDMFNPDMNQPIYKIAYSEEKIVREYNMKITEEMDIISRFVNKINNRAPIIVADKIAHSTINQCKEHDIPTELVIGIMFVESFYNPYAVGPPVGTRRRRARGLGQILDEKCGVEHIMKDKLHNIDYNIELIIKIIKSKLLATDGDLDKALYYYVGKDKEYAAKVFKTLGEFRYFRSQNL